MERRSGRCRFVKDDSVVTQAALADALGAPLKFITFANPARH